MFVCVCVCVWWVCSRFLGLSPGPPLRRTALPLDCPKFRSFFSLSRRKFRTHQTRKFDLAAAQKGGATKLPASPPQRGSVPTTGHARPTSKSTAMFYLGQFYLGQFYLGQFYLGQVRLRPNFCFLRFRPFSGLCCCCCCGCCCVVVVVVLWLLCVVVVVCCGCCVLWLLCVVVVVCCGCCVLWLLCVVVVVCCGCCVLCCVFCVVCSVPKP